LSLNLLKESKLLAKHSAIYGFGSLLNQAAAFLLLPVYTRFLTPYDYGVKELVGLSTDIVSILLATAISAALFRFYFEYEDQKERNEVVSSAIITVGSIGLVAVTLLSLATKTMANLILDDADLYFFFMISFSSMWFNALNNIGYSYLRANQQSMKFIAFSFGKLLMAIALNIYLVCFVKLGVLGVLISNLITAIVQSFLLVVPLIFKIGLRFSKDKIIEMLKFGLPMIPAQLGGFLVHISDRFFIKGLVSIGDAGLYSLGYRFGALPSTFISTPFNQIWFPRRMELYKQEGSEELFGKIFTYFVFLMIFAGLGVSILTLDILKVVADQKFWSAYKIVPLIVIGTTIFTFHYHFNMGIYIHKKTKYLAYINFSNGILILILNYVLIKKYGIYGAAYATIIAFIYKVSLTYMVSSKYYKIHFEIRRILKIFTAAILIYSCAGLINVDSLAVDLLIKSALIIIFPFILYMFGFYNKDEKKKVTALIENQVLKLSKNLRKNTE